MSNTYRVRALPHNPQEDLGRWLQEQFDGYTEEMVQPQWDSRWVPEFTLNAGDVYQFAPFYEYGMLSLICQDEANTYGMVMYNRLTPFITGINLGSSVTLTAANPGTVNLYIQGDLVTLENNHAAARTFRVFTF